MKIKSKRFNQARHFTCQKVVPMEPRHSWNHSSSFCRLKWIYWHSLRYFDYCHSKDWARLSFLCFTLQLMGISCSGICFLAFLWVYLTILLNPPIFSRSHWPYLPCASFQLFYSYSKSRPIVDFAVLHLLYCRKYLH